MRITEPTTLGDFVARRMAKQYHTNVSLAKAAGVSEGVIRNLLKHGIEKKAKDPDPRTLRRVADALEVEPEMLFRLAGYISGRPNMNSVRAEYLADVFDTLPPEKQDAVMGVLQAMADDAEHQKTIRKMRENPEDPVAGIDQNDSLWVRELANLVMMEMKILNAAFISVDNIDPDIDIIGGKWSDLSRATQERIVALIQHKLALYYEPTMVDPEWR